MNDHIKCPQCHKATIWSDNPWRPFCSQRCKMIDLGDWASEKHCIHEPLIIKMDDNSELLITNFDLHEMGTPHDTDDFDR